MPWADDPFFEISWIAESAAEAAWSAARGGLSKACRCIAQSNTGEVGLGDMRERRTGSNLGQRDKTMGGFCAAVLLIRGYKTV